MKFNILPFLIVITTIETTAAQSGSIFKSGFEYFSKLNDTGIIWAGETLINVNGCASFTIEAPQDCHTGRDFNHNDPSDGHAGFSYTKLDVNGLALLDQSADYATTPWSCVKDNVTGLIWEVKTTIADIHNKDITYKWGGLTAIGRNHPNAQGIYYDDWNELVQGSISENLCGFNDWRVPTKYELSSIVNKGTSDPAIDTNYFPNTHHDPSFWTSNPAAHFAILSWVVYFRDGYYQLTFREDDYHRVRLVRSVP